MSQHQNMERHRKILKQIEEDLTVAQVSFTDEYFVFDKGECAVCHFTVDETPGWLYGIWLNENNFEIFGEHEWLVGSFKPSQAYFSFNETASFIEKVKAVHFNPIFHLVDSNEFGALNEQTRWFWEKPGEAEAVEVSKEEFIRLSYEDLVDQNSAT